jgi:hypothetical protein
LLEPLSPERAIYSTRSGQLRVEAIPKHMSPERAI